MVLAVGLGNALEFYDFVTFSFFAIQIGHCFFPGEAAHGLLYALGTFGVGFVTRPLGGIIIGRYGDRAGRKPAMILSFMLMGVAITGLVLIPSYDQIGVAAPALLVGCRLLQGFALGGEVGPSTAFLIEVAPPNRRGLYLALQYATQDSAVLVAGIVGFALSNTLSPADLDAWGWRLAFIIGIAVVPVGLALRRGLPETLHADDSPAGGARVGRGIIILALMMLGSTTITTYVLDYMTTYAQDSLRLTAGLAFGATIILGLTSVIADLVCAALTDRVGRKPVMITAAITLLAVTIPVYQAMVAWPSVTTVYCATALLGTLASFVSVPSLITITEGLPKAVRSGSLAIIYAVAISGLGGTTQFAIKALTDATGSGLAPAGYLTAALIMGLTAMLITRETAPVKTGRA
jgi:MFS family permease